MAYNTRRSGGEGINNVGQRRNPSIGSSFVPAGQLASQNRPQQQGPGAAQGFQNQANGGNFRPQQQQQNQRMQQQQQQQQQPPRPLMQKQVGPAPQQQIQPQIQPQVQQQQQIAKMEEDATFVESFTTEQLDESEEGGKKRPFWANKLGKISRKERQRRRNVRLGRILQPKNAVMILNELVKNTAYTITDVPQPNANQYMASVLVEETNHIGYGHSKMEAKNNAAEAALKFIVKTRKLPNLAASPKKDEEGDEKMEEIADDQNSPLPWQHVASFALFKLLNSWGEDPFQARGQLGQNGPDGASTPLPHNKPAKKMPENAAQMNPLMLMNQMLPQAQFEELGRSGDPPNVLFTFKCVVNGQSFTGAGANKKAAKKQAAFAVCNKVLNVQYPPDVYPVTA